MSQFQIGDIVETIDHVIKALVEVINGEQITIPLILSNYDK